MAVQLVDAKNNWQNDVAKLAKSIQDTIHNNSPSSLIDYFKLNQLSNKLKERIKNATAAILGDTKLSQASSKDLAPFIELVSKLYKPLLSQCKSTLTQHEREKVLHERWHKLGLDPEFLTTNPDMVNFLFESGFAYLISGYHASLEVDRDRHTIAKDADGHPMLLVEGKMVRWEEFEKLVEIDKAYDVLKSKQDPSELWTYIESLGFTKQNIYSYKEPFAVHKLSEREATLLTKHAKTYYNTENPDPTPDIPKDAILQICTSLGRVSESKNTIVRAITRKIGSHYSIRIITKERQVYSIGYRRAYGELAHLQLSSALGQVRGTMGVNDFEELRPHDGRYVTTIPISSQNMEDLFDEIKKINQEVTPFDYFDENCVKMTERCLQRIGITVNTNARLEECVKDIANAFFKNIPVLGQLFRKVKRCIKTIMQKLPSLPPAVSLVAERVVTVLTYIPHKIFTLMKGLFVIAFGWQAASPNVDGCPYTHKRRFSILKDLLSDDASNLHYPRWMLRWQKQQATTRCHDYTGLPKFAILPPEMASSSPVPSAA